MLEECYAKIVHNESIYNKELGIRITFLMQAKLFFFNLFLFFSLFKNKLSFNKVVFHDPKSFDKIGLGWQPIHHQKLSQIIDEKFILDIGRNELSYWIRHYHLTDIAIAWKFSIKNSKFSSKYSYDSIWYRFHIYIIYEILDRIITGNSEVFISGHFDRYVTIISAICAKKNAVLHLVQHGCIQIFEKPLIKNLISGDVFYLFPFSKPYFKTFLNLSGSTKLLPQNVAKFNFDYQSPKDVEFIVFGCQDVNIEYNFTLIETILEVFDPCQVYIVPHPREKLSTYIKKYGSFGVEVSRLKPNNAILFISRFSTLGIEYADYGIETVFVNLDRANMDFIISGDYKVCETILEFKNFLIEKLSKV